MHFKFSLETQTPYTAKTNVSKKHISQVLYVNSNSLLFVLILSLKNILVAVHKNIFLISLKREITQKVIDSVEILQSK